ncbi:MAG: peptidoglycan DD-metalloendopeptidase family protein [Flavobacteriia bacterium]|nr:peptidoglycan DD-metalloendopeptidase family protein [Flavobacteriia bacterium]
MVNVNRILFLIFFFYSVGVMAQKSTEKLRKEQERIEKKINTTKSLLEKTKTSSQTTINELKLLEKQISLRENLIQNYDNQIKSNELKIKEKHIHIQFLENELKTLKNEYKKLLLYAYKKRNKSGQLMYLFSSSSYNQALNRKKYLDKLVIFQQNQKKIILQHQKLLNDEIKELEKGKKQIVSLSQVKKQEKELIVTDKSKQEQTLSKLKNEEQFLLTKLREDEKQRDQIKRQIDEAIQKELTSNKNKSSSTTKTVKKTKTKETFVEPQEYELNNSFESNKGRLPWPVSGGAITERYGKNLHPTIPNVYTSNNGVDFSVSKGANVRAVFEGEVSSVFTIPGAGKVVILKHGNYRTVYSNLQEVYVSLGSKVNTKQSIGSLLTQENENISVSHFEIHQVIGSNVNRMNPELWIAR